MATGMGPWEGGAEVAGEKASARGESAIGKAPVRLHVRPPHTCTPLQSPVLQINVGLAIMHYKYDAGVPNSHQGLAIGLQSRGCPAREPAGFRAHLSRSGLLRSACVRAGSGLRVVSVACSQASTR